MGHARNWAIKAAISEQRVDSLTELALSAKYYLDEKYINQWEHDFLVSVYDQHKSGRALSVKQEATIQDIEKKIDKGLRAERER